MRDAVALTCVLAVLATPAASLACRFTSECADTAPCAATDYSLVLQTHELAAVFVTPAGSFQGRLGVTPDGATFALALSPGAIHLLSLSAEAGSARYTTHLTRDGMAITYVGTCQDE